jgi:hypothetical protein
MRARQAGESTLVDLIVLEPVPFEGFGQVLDLLLDLLGCRRRDKIAVKPQVPK